LGQSGQQARPDQELRPRCDTAVRRAYFPCLTLLNTACFRFFNDVFAQDQLVFGAATATELELTRVSDLSTVQSTVERHMLSVKPTPKRKAGKRTRAAVIEAENQDETA
jgi:hypothetical protein